MSTTNATTAPAKPVEWVGSLSKVPLAEVLKRIALEERSGDLQVILGRAIKTVYFDRGFVVFAASNLKRDRLGESLIEVGRISRQEFALASMLMRGSKRRFGQALVQAGVLSEEELGRQVALQVNRIVLSLFKKSDGIYSFDERPCIIPLDLMVSLSIYRILLEGIRKMSDGRLILAGLPPLQTTVRVAERPPFTIDFRRLKRIEQSALRLAGRGATLASIVKRIDAERGPALRALYALYAAGLLEATGEAAPRRPLKVQEETGVFLLSDIQQKFARIRATNVRQEILMEFDRLDRISASDLLHVGSSARREEIDRAFEEARRRWEDKRRLVENERSLVVKVDEIRARLERAYEQMLREGAAAPPAAAEPPPEPLAEAGEEELPIVVEEAAEEEARPTELPPLDDELVEEVRIDTAVFRMADEPTAAAPPAPPVDTEPDAAAPPPEGPDTVPAEETTEAVAQQRRQRIGQLLRDVKLHFQVRDWEGAVSLLHELVRLEPNKASHHAMLARAMARHPVMRKDAERHFLDALRLAPQDADLHFSLGLYYKSFGLRARAETELRTALRINPRHEGARKHLGGDRPRKDPLAGMFRKIFG